MSQSNEGCSEEFPSNNWKDGAQSNDLKLYEFQAHFSYKRLYDQLRLLQIELNDENHDRVFAFQNRKNRNNEDPYMNKDQKCRNGGESRNIILNHFVQNNNNNDITSLDNLCLKNQVRTHQLINKNKINKREHNTLFNNKEKKEKDKERKKEECNNKHSTLIMGNKNIHTTNNKKKHIVRNNNALIINKKKPIERTAASMARPVKSNCNLGKVSCKPNSKSHPPLSRKKINNSNVQFPFHSINANNSKIVVPSSKDKANLTNHQQQPSSINISVQFKPLKMPIGTIFYKNKVSSSKPKETLSLLLTTENHQNSSNTPLTRKINKHHPLTLNLNKDNKTKNRHQIEPINGMKPHSQEKQKNFNLKYGGFPNQKGIGYQITVNHQTKEKPNKAKIFLNNGQSPNHKIEACCPLTLKICNTLINGKNTTKQPKEFIKKDITNQKSIPKPSDLNEASQNNNTNKPKNENAIKNSLSRNLRSSLESCENKNNNNASLTKTSKDKSCRRSPQQNKNRLKRNQNLFYASLGNKIFHTIDNSNTKNAKNVKAKHNSNYYNTNSHSQAGNDKLIMKQIELETTRIQKTKITKIHCKRIIFNLIKNEKCQQIKNSTIIKKS